MCFPHVINIVVQHTLSKLSRAVIPEADEDDDANEENLDVDSAANPQTREAAYALDPISRCRKIVVAIRSSGQRRQKFTNWIKTGT
jgi:hypothetical protein